MNNSPQETLLLPTKSDSEDSWGFIGHGNYSDLAVWSVWALTNAVLAIVSMINNKKAE